MSKPVRPFYWSIRRELWEHPAIWAVPGVVAVVGLVGFLVRAPWLLRDLGVPNNQSLMGPYVFTSLGVMVAALLVGVFYSLGALHNERRDRSIQFWKSLPVPDRTTILAKFAVPVLVLPAVGLAVTLGAQFVMLVLSMIVVLVARTDPGVLWTQLDLRLMWVALVYGFAINVLWLAPLHAWLLLISGWAKRAPVLWALGPPLALALFERITTGSSRIGQFLIERILGGFGEAFSVGGQGKAAIDKFSDMDPVHALANPHLWGGLAVAGLLLALTIRLRRSRDAL